MMKQEIADIPQRLQKLRLNTKRDIHECASLLDISFEQYQKYESGEALPSLPDIELLSVLFGVPIESFYLEEMGEISYYSVLNEETKSKYKQLRNKVIQSQLHIEQENKGTTFEELTNLTDIPIEILHQYSRGDTPISLKHLFLISDALERPISIFFNQELRGIKLPNIEPDQPQQQLENEIDKDKADQNPENPFDPLTQALREIPVEEQAEIAKIILGKLKKTMNGL